MASSQQSVRQLQHTPNHADSHTHRANTESSHVCSMMGLCCCMTNCYAGDARGCTQAAAVPRMRPRLHGGPPNDREKPIVRMHDVHDASGAFAMDRSIMGLSSMSLPCPAMVQSFERHS